MWLNIKGLTLQLLNEEALVKVGEVFGRIVHKPSRSELDADLSYNDYIGISIL